MPKVATQRWSCHSCGDCCRTLVVHVFEHERQEIERLGSTEALGDAPLVRVGGGWVLNKRPDGACVFLDDQDRCRIHSAHGEKAKPLACRLFPFSVRAVEGAWQATLRFDCPSAVASKGEPLDRHRAWISTLSDLLPRQATSPGDGALLSPGPPATPDEIDAITKAYLRWMNNTERPLTERLVGAARVSATLSGAKLAKVRGPRLRELLDVLFGSLPVECTVPPAAPSRRQAALLRQSVFAHTQHLSLCEIRSGCIAKLRKRCQQVVMAWRFRSGKGTVPKIPGLAECVTFASVEAVRSAPRDPASIDDLLERYVAARITGRAVFGQGYYGFDVFDGLTALWLSVAVVGWLARLWSALEGRETVVFDGVAHALGMVDRAATRVPVLGAFAERSALSYLMQDDGVARLISRFPLVDAQS